MTDLQQELDVQEYLQTTAKDIVLRRNNDVAKAGPDLEAELCHEMFVQSVEMRRKFRDFQGQLAAYVFREHLWVHYPHVQFSDDYKGFRAFLASTGLGDSTVSEVAALYWVVPLCDQNDLEIDRYIGPGQWSTTRETITALKQAAREQELSQVRRILASIDETRGASITIARAALREQWRTQRGKDKPGHGTTVRLPGGKQAIVVVFEHDEDIKSALIRLGPLTTWDLLHVKLETR